MSMVINCYLIYRKSENEVISKSAWVDYDEDLKSGDGIMFEDDTRLWELHTVYAGSTKEEVVQMYPHIVIGKKAVR